MDKNLLGPATTYHWRLDFGRQEDLLRCFNIVWGMLMMNRDPEKVILFAQRLYPRLIWQIATPDVETNYLWVAGPIRIAATSRIPQNTVRFVSSPSTEKIENMFR